MIIGPDLLLMFITRLEKKYKTLQNGLLYIINTKPFKMVYFISKHLSFLADLMKGYLFCLKTPRYFM